jgi:16S rRNA (cytosine967-C5)-methyltransferase
MVKRWLARFGKEHTEQLLIANNAKPSLSLRVNNLVTNKTELKSLLNNVNLKYTESIYVKDFIKLNILTNITDWGYFANGYFSVQDESTGIPVYLLDPKPGMRVLDLCAAPGGKTGLIADLMNNEGEIIALDKYESRAKILEKNLNRLKITNVKIKVADALEYNDGLFDRVLIDAPCSGLGTLTKKPDVKWKKDLGDIRKLNISQFELLEKGASLVKPGGYLVYSTCTMEPEENFSIIQKFLFGNPHYELDVDKSVFPKELYDENGCLSALPHLHNIDGSFSARIKRIS